MTEISLEEEMENILNLLEKACESCDKLRFSKPKPDQNQNEHPCEEE